MLIKIKISTESMSTYLTKHIDGDINTEEITNNIISQILSNVSCGNIVQKGKGSDFIYFLITNLSESKSFLSKVVDVTKVAVKKAIQPRLKITFLCSTDLLTSINEFAEKDVITTKILNYNIANKIVTTPATKTYYETLYKDFYDFNILGEYNLGEENNENIITLYSISSK